MSNKKDDRMLRENNSQNPTKIKIPLRDVFFIGDIEKYYKYGETPYLFFIHIFLVILTTGIVSKIFLILDHFKC